MTEFKHFEVAASLKHKVSTTYSVKHRGRHWEQMKDSLEDETTERIREQTPQPTTDEFSENTDE